MPDDTQRTIRLALDAGMLAKLAELADFHGETPEETIRICIRHEWNSLRMLEAEFEELRRNPAPREPQPDDEIPY